MTTFNDRLVEILRDRVQLHVLVGRTAAGSAQRARSSTVELVRHEGWPAIRVERDSRHIDRCTTAGDNRHIDGFIDLLSEAMTRSRIDLVHMAEWEPVTGMAIFAAADRAGIPWMVMPVDYRLVCPQMWLFEQGLRDCSGPDETFAKCARCMAVGAPHLDLPGTQLIGLAKKALYYSGIRPVFPTLLAPHLPRYFNRKGWHSRFEMIRRQLQTCRAIVTISDLHGRVLREILGLPAEIFRTVRYPSQPPPPGYQPNPRRFRPPLKFVWIHRLGREWGPYLLLDAWKRAGVSREQAQLVMYSGTRAKGVTLDRVRGAGYGDLLASGSVVVTEERVQGREAQVLSDVAAVVETPLWKANGCSYESFVYGYPVIFPRGTAIAEVYQEGVTGFGYAQGDAASLAEVFRLSAMEPSRLENAAALNTFKPEYGPAACGDALVDLYRAILGRGADEHSSGG
jgi:glycosyltransferase involved in cell wall biosynthesis